MRVPWNRKHTPPTRAEMDRVDAELARAFAKLDAAAEAVTEQPWEWHPDGPEAQATLEQIQAEEDDES